MQELLTLMRFSLISLIIITINFSIFTFISNVPSIAPSVSPSLSITPSQPTWTPTSNYLCPSYYASDTYYAYYNTIPCVFSACEGAGSIRISSLAEDGGSCWGIQFIRLYNSQSIEVAENSYGGGNGCALLVYTPAEGSGCEVYTLQQGCEWYDDCGGTFSVQADVIHR